MTSLAEAVQGLQAAVAALQAALAPPSSSPPPATAPTGDPPSWTDVMGVGPTKPYAHVVSGALFDTVASITGHPGFAGGTGTASDPYVIDSVHFTDGTLIGSYSASTLKGRVLKFTDSWFQGDVSTGDLDGLCPPLGVCINGRTAALPARVIAEDCRFAPSGSPIAAGGPSPTTGGLGFAFICNDVPFDLLRCDLWGSACNIAYVNDDGLSAPLSTVKDCWSHDQWVSGGAHTDNVNGADPTNASNVSFDHCVIDGKCGQRTNSRVVNGFGIYNTKAITGWSINNCLIKNADFGIFWAQKGVAAAIANMTVTNNVFDLSNLGQAFYGRTDILTQSGNKDSAGNPLVFA